MESNNFENKHENEARTEVLNLLTQLDQEAGKMGVVLEDTDFTKIDTEGAMKVQAKIEIILSTLAILAGLTIAHEAMPQLSETTKTLESFLEHLAKTGMAAGGVAVVFAGLKRLEIGCKKFLGYIQMKELRDLKSQ